MPIGDYTETEISPVSMTAYRDWAPVPLADPRSATVPQLVFGMTEIVEAEGPVIADRVFHLFAKASGLGRIYEATRRRMIVGLRQALRDGVILSESEGSEDPGNWVLRLPSQDRVSVRTLGGRTLHEVPAAEVAEIMLEIRVRDELISRDELFRAVLAQYDLIRLTEATRNRLDYILRTWF